MKFINQKKFKALSHQPIGNNPKGLSLLELMVVMCMVSFLIGFGIISLKPLYQKNRLEAEIQKLAGTIQLLRVKSILENKTYELRFQNKHLEYRRKSGSTWQKWNQKQVDEEIEYSFHGSLYFNSKGFLTPKTIWLKLGDLQQNIVININGRIRFSEIF